MSELMHLSGLMFAWVSIFLVVTGSLFALDDAFGPGVALSVGAVIVVGSVAVVKWVIENG